MSLYMDGEKTRLKEQDTITAFLLRKRRDLNPAIIQEWATAFIEAGKENDLDPRFIIQVSIIESGVRQMTPYGITLVSSAGAEGMMQVMGRYWGHGQIPFIHNPDELRHTTLNIRAGAYILRYYLDMYKGDVELALLAYNRGEGAVNRDLRRGINPSNGYVKRVLMRVNPYL